VVAPERPSHKAAITFSWGALLTAAVWAFILSYPLAGLLHGVWDVAQAIYNGTALQGVGFVIFYLALWTVLTTVFLGFPPLDESGAHFQSMYGWIVPVSAALFVLFYRPWRWLRRDG
jgi:hypothetical protein